MKYLDKDGLTHLWDKIKAKIPTKTSQITNDSNFITNTGSTSGNAGSATKLQTARTIGIGTGATGTATSFNGTANITIPITDVKEAYVTWGGKGIAGSISPDDMGCVDEFGHNKLAFLPAGCITAEYTTDGGTTWLDYGLNDNQKISLTTTTGAGCSIGKGTATASGGTMTNANCGNYQVRVKISTRNGTGLTYGSLYTKTRKFLVNVNTNGAGGCKLKVETRSITNYNNNADTWSTQGTYDVSGWSGWNSIPANGWFFGGSSSQGGNIADVRFTLYITSVNTSYTCVAQLLDFRLIGETNWSYPSEMARAGHLYSIDTAKNAYFPNAIVPSTNNAQIIGTSAAKWANVYATSFTGNLVGNADTATSATTATKANNVNIADTRSVNSTPSDYMSAGRRVVYEFKSRTVVGSPFSSGDFVTLKTIVQWDNNSGGRPVQLAFSSGFNNIAYRVATSDSEWGAWKLLATKDDVPSLTNYYYALSDYDSTHNSLSIVRQSSAFNIPVLDNSTYKLKIGNVPTASSISNDSNTVPTTAAVNSAISGFVNSSQLNALEEEIYSNVYLKTEVDNKIAKSANFMVVGMGDTQTVNQQNTIMKVNLDSIATSNGSLLTFNSTAHNITIGEGVHHVEITGNIYITTLGTAGLKNAYIYKNNAIVGRTVLHLSQGYQSILVTPNIIDVSQGDTIDLRVNSQNGTTTVLGASYGAGVMTTLVVKVID